MKTLYIRTNVINGMQYVGQTSDFKRRERDWRKLGSSYANKILDSDRIEYGLDSFTVDILEEVDDSIADKKEREYITKYNTLYPNGYNVYSGGISNFTFKVDERIKKKISEATKGIPKSSKTREKISKGLKNHLAKSKQVYQYTLNKELVTIYPSAREAARETGFSQGNISNCCNGGFYSKKRNKWVNKIQSNGYIWSNQPL